MWKKLIFLTVSLLVVALGVALFVIAPYHIYTLTLTEGVATPFLIMKPSKSPFYDGRDFSFPKDLSNSKEDQSLYTTFHFSNFQMPLPFNHPIFSLIPSIQLESTGPRLGGSFIDGKDFELFSFKVEKNYKFETNFGDQKLFLLPIFKNHITRKIDEDVWRDLFYKKLSLPSNVGKSFYESLMTLKKVSYSDLVYNLYILYNRNNLFPQNTLRISYDEKSRHGLIELPSDDPKYLLERLFILDNGIIYSMTIKSKKDHVAADHFREKILKETTYKSSTVDSAIPIYAQYKNISYSNRVDQQGMTALFVAWSHDLDNREYIKMIILFLERGRSNLKFLKPFYEYAYKKFGSSLSSDNEMLLENAEEKLKRRMKDELEVEVTKEEQKKKAKFEGNFNSPEDKIKFYLEKAKETKTNSDDTSKVLMQE